MVGMVPPFPMGGKKKQFVLPTFSAIETPQTSQRGILPPGSPCAAQRWQRERPRPRQQAATNDHRWSSGPGERWDLHRQFVPSGNGKIEDQWRF